MLKYFKKPVFVPSSVFSNVTGQISTSVKCMMFGVLHHDSSKIATTELQIHLVVYAQL